MEIIVESFQYLSLRDLIKNELICKYLQFIIRSIRWQHTISNLDFHNKIKYITINYHFRNYNFDHCDDCYVDQDDIRGLDLIELCAINIVKK